MALLGFLAAGAAMGARDASNNSVRAQNELELSRARNGMEMDREALRMKYEEKRYQQQREDAKEAGKAKMQLEEARYKRDRENKLADREAEHKFKMQIEGGKEAGRNARFNQRQSLLRDNANKSSGNNGVGEGFNPKSPEGKAAADLVASGRAANLDEAYDDVHQMKLLSGIAGNGMLSNPEQLFSFYDQYKRERSTRRGSGGQLQNPQELIRNFNPKTGRFE